MSFKKLLDKTGKGIVCFFSMVIGLPVLIGKAIWRILDYESGRLKWIVMGLIYPSVLGSFVYDIVKNIYEKISASGTGLFSRLTEYSWIKAGLILSILFFYSCDYLYANAVTRYKRLFLLFDIVGIVCLVLAFNAIHIYQGSSVNKGVIPSLEFIAGPLSIFLTIFLLWDIVIISNKKNKGIEGKMPFYKNFVKVEGLVLLILSLTCFFYRKNMLRLNVSLWIVIGTLLALSSYYFWSIKKKEEIEKKEKVRDEEERKGEAQNI